MPGAARPRRPGGKRFLRRLAFLFVLGLSAAGRGAGTQEAFPSIERLDARDPAFKQYVADVDLARRRLFGGGKDDLAEFLRVYAYSPGPEDDLFRLSARCNIPYPALATLNRLGHPDGFKDSFGSGNSAGGESAGGGNSPGGGAFLLPTVPGLFIPETPRNDLERLMASSRVMEGGTVITLRRGARQERFLFFPGGDFNPTERSYFLNTGFRFPLRSYRISSPFGMRPSPFTGRLQNHNGLDLAAPQGTEVYAAREGKVAELGTDPVYGNYIIVAHDNGWASLYGHLSAFSTALHSAVTRDSVIGRVGSTGQSTGPHLHFELRKNGTALDPTKLLFRN